MSSSSASVAGQSPGSDISPVPPSASSSTVTPDGTLEMKEEAAVEKALNAAEGEKVTLQAKWKTHSYTFAVPVDCTIGFLKMQIAIQTNVKPTRQKLIFKSKSKYDDLSSLRSLSLPSTSLLLIIGNEEKDIPSDRDDIGDVLDDFDDTDYPSVDTSVSSHPEHRRQLEKYKGLIEITYINPPRPNKRLLVLDLDYTLFDMKTESDNYTKLKRPFTHRFLTALYPYYELVIWSQTSWRWLEMKLTELGILTHPSYRILFVLDKSTMFRVTSSHDGEARRHHVKPLDLIWHKLPHYSPVNTVHVDDLSRNFAFNPQSGLRIKAYKNSVQTRGSDRELRYLMEYLKGIAETVTDFRELNHSEWREWLEKRGKSVEYIDQQLKEGRG